MRRKTLEMNLTLCWHEICTLYGFEYFRRENISHVENTWEQVGKQIGVINKINRKIHLKPECSPSTSIYLDISATHCH